MKNHVKIFLAVMLIGMLSAGMLFGQDDSASAGKKGFEFTTVIDIPNTPVSNQFRSGTCWSFAGNALFEAEILRMKGKEMNLSEMFIVRHAYADKAKKYVRLHGHLNLAAGGGFSDLVHVKQTYGIVPEEAYPGLVIGEEKHTHGEMDAVLKAYADAVKTNKNRKLSPVWHQGFNLLLDTYLGAYPTEFTYEGKQYTPKSFADETGLDMDDYIELTSFLHREYYKPFVMEIPDNWMWSQTWNLPLEELIETLNYAMEQGYTVAWGADVSEKGFSWRNGVAVVPDETREDVGGTERERWESLSAAERQKALYSFEEPLPEKAITPEIRQRAYDNYETTDDHGMLFVGTATDQNGTIYYKVKNSWGHEDHKYDGYLYASETYVRYKTMNIFLHKDAIPKHILKKLKL
jgi:bleomycin hydrolase